MGNICVQTKDGPCDKACPHIHEHVEPSLNRGDTVDAIDFFAGTGEVRAQFMFWQRVTLQGATFGIPHRLVDGRAVTGDVELFCFLRGDGCRMGDSGHYA